MRLGRDGVTGLIALAVSLVLLVQSFHLPSLPLVPVGPGFYPKIVLALMVLASLLLILQDLAAGRKMQGQPQPPAVRRNITLVSVSFGIVAAYIVLLPYLGFRAATLVFVAALQMALERPRTVRQWAILLALSVGTTAIGYLVFERYLSVLLPRGLWTGM